jgi:DinB family protein
MTSQIADDLSATVKEYAGKLRRLDSATVSYRPAPDRWTIKEVIGHLIDSCANNHQRFIRAQFTDELVFPKYEQNQWVSAQHYDGADWLDLLDLWRQYNLHLARVIRNMAHPTKA